MNEPTKIPLIDFLQKKGKPISCFPPHIVVGLDANNSANWNKIGETVVQKISDDDEINSLIFEISGYAYIPNLPNLVFLNEFSEFLKLLDHRPPAWQNCVNEVERRLLARIRNKTCNDDFALKGGNLTNSTCSGNKITIVSKCTDRGQTRRTASGPESRRWRKAYMKKVHQEYLASIIEDIKSISDEGLEKLLDNHQELMTTKYYDADRNSMVFWDKIMRNFDHKKTKLETLDDTKFRQKLLDSWLDEERMLCRDDVLFLWDDYLVSDSPIMDEAKMNKLQYILNVNLATGRVL